MKLKHTFAILASLTLLASCGGSSQSSASVDPAGNTYKTTTVYMRGLAGRPMNSGAVFRLLFKKGSEIPYVSINDGFMFMNLVKGQRFGDTFNRKYYYRVSQSGNQFTVVNETGAKAILDPTAQTIAYEDFDSFVTLCADSAKPLMTSTPAPGSRAIKALSIDYKKGSNVTVDLKSYAGIDLYPANGTLYLPLTTFSDLFYNHNEYTNMVYNGKNVYVVPNNSLTAETEKGVALTPFGSAFYDAVQRPTLSQEILGFNYSEACLNFDHFYGLKQDKGFATFASFIAQKGFKADFDNADVKKADDALRLTLTHLVDGHSAQTMPSFFYPFGTSEPDDTRVNPDREAWSKGSDSLEEARPKTAPLGNHLDEANKTYFIAFNTFTTLDETLLYTPEAYSSEERILANTAMQFASAYRYLTSEEAKLKVRNVVIDLSTNGGGAADGLIYALSAVLGKVRTNTRDPWTGATNETVYQADLNVDGVVDQNDVGLIDKGFNIAVLSSKYTFSSANAFACFAKANNAKVITAGETSGGGACVVRPVVTPLGSSLYTSGNLQLCVKKDGQLSHVDQGVAADVAIAQTSLFDRAAVAAAIDKGVK